MLISVLGVETEKIMTATNYWTCVDCNTMNAFTKIRCQTCGKSRFKEN